MAEKEESHRVVLNLYDLSRGLARQFSTALLGKPIEGICPRYTAETYSLLGHNCNNFSNEVAQFLVGSTIPNYILQLPNDMFSSPIGRLMLPMIQNLDTTLRSGAVPTVPQVRHTQPTVTSTPVSVLASDVKESAGCDVGPSGGSASKATKGRSAEQNTTEISTHLVIKPAAGAGQQELPGKTTDEGPLADSRAMIQDRINGEFASIMATGKFRASEAAALAARRVMSKYTSQSHTRPAASQD